MNKLLLAAVLVLAPAQQRWSGPTTPPPPPESPISKLSKLYTLLAVATLHGADTGPAAPLSEGTAAQCDAQRQQAERHTRG
jgi:hypothetical protein